LVLSLLPLAALGAKKSAGDTFQVFHSKSLAAPVKLQDATYDQLTTAPRNHSAAILLTALEAKYGCQLCREFQGEWDILARSWTKGDKQGASRLVYGTLDFADGRGTFQSLGLQTAPVILLFRPTVGPHAVADTNPLRFDFTSGPQSAEQVHAWIARNLPDRPHPEIYRPINWIRII
ncbi:hypothetical protein DH86_00001604, partial [Scytalidium sp. 3C]